MPEAYQPVHRVIAGEEHAYSSHAHSVRLAGGAIALVFNQSMRRARPHHPPSDPLFRNMLTRSLDGGATWSAPRVAPGYDWSGTECAGLTALPNGALLLHQWRFRWYTIEAGIAASSSELVTLPDDLPAYRGRDTTDVPWARGLDGAWVHRSTDGGLTWESSTRIDTTPHPGGYGIRSAARLPNGRLVLPLSDVPNWEVILIIESDDDGRSWGPPRVVAKEVGKMFEEPAIVAFDDGQLVMLIRESPGDHLHHTTSTDGGRSWSPVAETAILGNPPHLLILPDGRLLCTYGYRYEPYEIHGVVSVDRGASWGMPFPIRSGLGEGDIGYPASVLLDDGQILTVYYGDDERGVKSILSTTWRLRD